MDILIFSILTNFVYFCSGNIVQTHFKFKDSSIFFSFFLGVIIISFIGLFFNFFLPLSKLTNSIIYILIFIIFFTKNKLNINKKVFIFLIISSFITFLLIIYSNVNRPDAGLYHLPYVSILNENKIFFGISNIHFRFAHTSLLQYLSAMNNNHLFLNNGIIIPIASVVSFFYIYFFLEVWNTVKEKKPLNVDKIFSLFILIYIGYKITRYSSFGNDALAHLSYFYLVSCILKNKLNEININKILLISVFIFINKPMLGIVFLMPTVIFLIQNNLKLIKIFNQMFSFPVLLLLIWLIKNIITSGCIIFPVKYTCIERLPWTDIQQIKNSQLEGQAWSKAWPDRIDKNISMEEFNKDFNWLSAWKQKHMKYIVDILFPYILILTLITISIKYKNKITKSYDDTGDDLNKRMRLIMLISVIGIFSFFIIFPIYRYGYSYFITLISLIFAALVKKNLKSMKNIFIFKFFLIIFVLAFGGKQLQKLKTNENNDLWPNIYTFDMNKHKKIYTKQKILIKENFYYYHANKGDNLCMYSKSPCTSYVIKKNIKHTKKFGYSLFLVM